MKYCQIFSSILSDDPEKKRKQTLNLISNDTLEYQIPYYIRKM